MNSKFYKNYYKVLLLPHLVIAIKIKYKNNNNKNQFNNMKKKNTLLINFNFKIRNNKIQILLKTTFQIIKINNRINNNNKRKSLLYSYLIIANKVIK